MARTATPWFDKQKNQWTIWHKGKRIRLGPTRKEAMQAYHEIMARGQRPITAGSDRANFKIDVFWPGLSCFLWPTSSFPKKHQEITKGVIRDALKNDLVLFW